jgi:hypothetical protein
MPVRWPTARVECPGYDPANDGRTLWDRSAPRALHRPGSPDGRPPYLHLASSPAATSRPGWTLARTVLREGDTLVVWRLDRLGCSLKRLIETITQLDDDTVAFRSLQERLVPGSTGGRLVFHTVGALTEFKVQA